MEYIQRFASFLCFHSFFKSYMIFKKNLKQVSAYYGKLIVNNMYL
jgi:hypothetical protein